MRLELSDELAGPILIAAGVDVWIGHGAIGVHISTGAVVGSAALVTKEVAPYSIVVGVPARPIQKRFSDEVIAALLKIAWWDWDRETLKARFHELCDVAAFVAKYETI